jgi:DNA invertase Pin-like site-specific DNA recombinase
MTTAERPKAYSYIRWSTPEQSKGNSLERQTKKARAWAQARGYELDNELTAKLVDRGISAYRGRNATDGALGTFLAAVREGIVPRGSFLIVESLDRISRDTIHKAARTLQDIVEEGVSILDLEDGERVYNEETFEREPFAFLIMAIRFMRGNMESRLKSERVGGAYEDKRKAAAQGTESKPFTRMLPAWLQYNEEKRTCEAIPERADVIRTIFKLSDEGLGQHKIARYLNERNEPTWGGHGNQHKAECWHRSYVRKLLTNSAVVGTFTPHQKQADTNGKRGKRVRKPLDPIEGYFPSVVDPELFERVSSRVRAPAARGRNASAEPASIFAGLLRCVHCGGFVTRVSKGEFVYLVCSRANRRGTKACRYLAVRYEDVESAFRQNAATILKEAPRGKNAADIEAEIARLDTQFDIVADEARDIADELLVHKSSTLRQKLKDKEAEIESMRERLRTLREKRLTLASRYVLHRLRGLRDALKSKPFNVVTVNKALKEAVSKIVIDPEDGSFDIYWHHAPEKPTEDVRFVSRHTALAKDKTGLTPRRKDKHAEHVA